jgi:hypothetical protein
MCDDWAPYHELCMYLCYFDMFYIQWHCLAKKDQWNKVHMNINIIEGLNKKEKHISCNKSTVQPGSSLLTS